MKRTLSLSAIAVSLAVLFLTGTVYSRGSHAITPETASLDASSQAVEQTSPVASPDCGAPVLSEEEAQRAVWSLPEVQEAAEELRSRGVRPFTMTISEPEPGAAAGSYEGNYVIYFGEDHGTHTVQVWTFAVDSRTGKVSTLLESQPATTQ